MAKNEKKVEQKNTENVIFISYQNGDVQIIYENEWSDYSYDGKCFIVKNGDGEWVGIYNLDVIAAIQVREVSIELLKDESYLKEYSVTPIAVPVSYSYEEDCDCEGCECYEDCDCREELEGDGKSRVIDFPEKTDK